MDTHRKAQKAHHRAHRHKPTTTTTTTASWCCSFKSPPKSPDSLSPSKPKPYPTKPPPPHVGPTTHQSKPSYPNSPVSSKSSGLGFVGRILSPGRVSPIGPDPSVGTTIKPDLGPSEVVFEDPLAQNEVGLSQNQVLDVGLKRVCSGGSGECCYDEGLYDVRLSLKAKNGNGFLVLELSSLVLEENSLVFAGVIREWREHSCGSNGGGRGSNGGSGSVCCIEVPNVENLGVFRETIELMFEKDITNKLIKVGAYRAVEILEVSANIKFNRGVVSCLKYLEAVPWTEEEEEKLRRLFENPKFDNEISDEILSRFNLPGYGGAQQKLASKLVHSIISCDNANARNELKSMVKGLLSRSSVYRKDHLDISKEDIYSASQSCLSTLVEQVGNVNPDKPLIESISWQVGNINWLLEILLDHQIAEDFVDIWANQKELLELRDRVSPMVRYELSRVSATLFVAIGTRALQCRTETRTRLIRSWFVPMIQDFGWLRRCKKQLDTRELEEAMGQALLTLPLKQQYPLFMEWFKCFSKHGNECPNLSKAFQIWWRRSFLRGSETHAIESR